RLREGLAAEALGHAAGAVDVPPEGAGGARGQPAGSRVRRGPSADGAASPVAQTLTPVRRTLPLMSQALDTPRPSTIRRDAGLYVCNVMGMRRALAQLAVSPAYVLTDGFPVPGTGVPGLAVWKGDRVAACIAAASVVAKVTRDRIMVEMHERWPHYQFDEHKG